MNKEVRQMEGAALASIDQGVSEIDSLVNEIENYPERFPPRILKRMEEIGFVERMKGVRKTFREIAQDIEQGPPND